MKKALLCFHLLFAAVIVLLIIFPPFYAIDTESHGKIHEAMGYYPICNAPTSKDAYYFLVNSGKINAVAFENGMNDTGITRYTAEFNTVRFITNFVIAALLYSAILIALKRLSKRKQ